MKRLLYLLAISLMSGIWLSCAPTKYVPVETIKYQDRYIEKVKYDSIYGFDSVFVDRKGDTIWINKYKYLYKYLFITKTDSFVQRDSIQVPYPVERQLTRWQFLKMEIGGLVMGGVLILLIALIIVGWMAYKSRKK